MTFALLGLSYWTLPTRIFGLSTHEANWVSAFWCCFSGLWSGLIIGYVTEYYTSYDNSPTQELSESCTTGAATNIIYGLALGHLSTIIPVILLAATAFICHS